MLGDVHDDEGVERDRDGGGDSGVSHHLGRHDEDSHDGDGRHDHDGDDIRDHIDVKPSGRCPAEEGRPSPRFRAECTECRVENAETLYIA